MKKLIPFLALLVIAAVSPAQTSTIIRPEVFNLSGLTTTESIKTILFEDSVGMYLKQLPGSITPQGTSEVGIELAGNTYAAPGTDLSFSISALATSDGRVACRVEQFNYITQKWDVLVRTKTSQGITAGRPYLAPSLTVTVPASDYTHPETGEVKTRVYWNSSTPFRTLWIDFAGWVLDHD